MTENGIQTTMPVTPAGYTGGNDMFGGGGFGGGWFAWILIFFLVFAGGWGNGGWGGNSNGALPGYTQTNDFSNLERENDIIRSDICQNFANTNQLLATGLQGIQTQFAQAELSRSNTQAALMGQMYQQNIDAMQNANALSRQFGEGICQTNYNNSNNTRDIVQAVEAEGRATRELFFNARMEDKDAQIANLTQQLNNANLAASQAAQNSYLVNTLRPAPIPAYQTVNPWSNNGCGCYNGCNGMA